MKNFCRKIWKPKPTPKWEPAPPGTSYLYFCSKCGIVLKPTPLTLKELEVLRAYGEGLSTQEIADKRCVSVKTVESHRQKIVLKMGVPNILSAVVLAIRRGYIILQKEDL